MKKHHILPRRGTISCPGGPAFGPSSSVRNLASISPWRSTKSMRGLTEKLSTDKTGMASNRNPYLRNTIFSPPKKPRISRRISYHMNIAKGTKSDSNFRSQLLQATRKRTSIASISTNSTRLSSVGRQYLLESSARIFLCESTHFCMLLTLSELWIALSHSDETSSRILTQRAIIHSASYKYFYLLSIFLLL